MFSFRKRSGFGLATVLAAASFALVAPVAFAAPATVSGPDTPVACTAAIGQVPASTQSPTVTQNPSGTPSPVATQLPSVTQTPGTGVSPTPTPSESAPPVIKPAAVSGLVADTSVIDSLKLVWQQPLNPGSLPVTDYKITYKFDDFGSWLTWKHPVSCLTNSTITDLPLGLGVTFGVRAIAANAVSPAVTVHVVTPIPSSPVGLTPPTQQQYQFLAATWNARTAPKFGYLPARDCANWASQSLLLRGLVPSGVWHGRLSRTRAASMAWISSTRLRNYLLTSNKVTPLTDAQRDQVAIGDIVQFDWWNTGAEEHTGVVSSIQHTAAGIKIYYASHTAHGMWWSVDRSIKTVYPGATVSYLHIN